ncbi:MAG: hypothetical protein AAF438_14140 [Pseudomonadota bacterium]
MRVTKTMFAVLACVFIGVAQGQEKGAIEVKTVAEKEEVLLAEDGTEESKLVPVSTVVPGDEIVYTVTFTNISEETADNVTVVDPIPDQMTYVRGSVFGPGADITFSVDGGATFEAEDDLRVATDNGGERTAQPEDYTHIRWVLRNPLGPGKRGVARFRAVLR